MKLIMKWGHVSLLEFGVGKGLTTIWVVKNHHRF